jgi:hypothetical protein
LPSASSVSAANPGSQKLSLANLGIQTLPTTNPSGQVVRRECGGRVAQGLPARG